MLSDESRLFIRSLRISQKVSGFFFNSGACTVCSSAANKASGFVPSPPPARYGPPRRAAPLIFDPARPKHLPARGGGPPAFARRVKTLRGKPVVLNDAFNVFPHRLNYSWLNFNLNLTATREGKKARWSEIRCSSWVPPK